MHKERRLVSLFLKNLRSTMANPNVIMFLPRRRLNFDAEIRQSLFCYNSLTEYGLVPIIAHHLSVKTSMYLGETLSSCNWNPPPLLFFFTLKQHLWRKCRYVQRGIQNRMPVSGSVSLLSLLLCQIGVFVFALVWFISLVPFRSLFHCPQFLFVFSSSSVTCLLI